MSQHQKPLFHKIHHQTEKMIPYEETADIKSILSERVLAYLK